MKTKRRLLEGLSVDILKNRNFCLLVFTRTCVLMTLNAQAVIVGWQVYSLTKSPFLLGLTGLAEALPAIACALWAGHVVDRGHPRKIYKICLAALALNTLALMVFAGGAITLAPTVVLAVLFGGVFISGLVRSLFIPAAFSMFPMIIKREDYAAAASWQTTGHQVASIGGPAIGGLLYGGYGALGAWIFPVFTIFMAFMMAGFIRIKDEIKKEENRLPALKSIREGWRFLRANSVLLSLMSLDMLAVLLGGAVAMLPAFADQVLHVGAEGLGALRAAPALGAVVTALYFALKPMRRITMIRFLIVMAGFGVSIIGFGLSTSLWVAMVFLALSGAFDSVGMVIRGTLFQTLTPDAMRGRVSSVNSMFVISSNELGAFESGVMAALFGLVPSIIIGGVGTIVVMGLAALASPKFRKLQIET